MRTYARLVAAAAAFFVTATLAVPMLMAAPAGATTTGTTFAVPVCGVADPAGVLQPTTPVPTNAVVQGPGGLTVSWFGIANNEIYVVDFNTWVVRRYGLDGAFKGSISVGSRLSTPSVAVDTAGNVYVAEYPASLTKLSPTGSVLWTKTVGLEITGVYAFPNASGFRVGAVSRGITGSTLYDSAGTSLGTVAVTGSVFSPAPDGGIVATDGAYVRTYNASGAEVGVFGDSHVANDPQPTGGPFHFYQQGGAVIAPDGTYYIADATRGIESATAQGYWRGLIGDETVGYLTERSPLAIANGRLYFAAGGRFNPNQRISSISVTDAGVLRTAPREPNPVLGFGAGVATTAVGNYFAAGQTPRVEARFDSSWVGRASGLRLSYTVRDHRQVIAGTAPAPTVVNLPTTAEALAAIPLTLPVARPGPYEVDARLLAADGSVVGTTCLTYTVGAAGHRLDFATLPAGADYGGPAPARGVALADVLGTGNFRASIDWAVLLPSTNGAMNFSAYDAAFAAAAQEAAARGVEFHVQIGAGHPVEQGLVQAGTWGQRVGELVAHFKSTVHTWEVWNEPNITYGAADAYVNQILRPASQAIRAADPSARIIGGSVVGIDLAYYDGIGRAGGFPLMDIVSVHPYTGHNRSWEEQGTPAAISGLRSVLTTFQANTKPLWITEAAWWADGPGNFLPQAAKVARGLVWSKTLGVERWYYFMMEGGYGDYGFSYSLIESGAQPDDYVKPGALAAMTTSAQLSGRAFTGWVTTGIPHTWAARFGARSGGTDNVVVAWSDDLDVTARLTPGAAATLTLTDTFGDASTSTLASGQTLDINLSGLPTFISLPASTSLSIASPEPFGTNMASSIIGGRATASTATSTNPATAANDSKADALDKGDIVGLPAWASAPGDTTPSLTVTLPGATSIDRILVGTHSPGSVVTSLRDYDVAVQENGTWVTVAQVRNQFNVRNRLVTFAGRTATAVRVTVTDVNYSGQAAGAKPWFWPTDTASLTNASATWYGPAVIYELEAYATGGSSTVTPPPTAPPAPANLTAPGVSDTQINLGWTGSTGASSYDVERSTDGVNFVSRGTTTATNWADVGLTAGTTYHFRVRAAGTGGVSGWSSVLAATTTGGSTPPPPPPGPTAPAAPTGLASTGATASAIGLSWTASTGATSYSVQRSSDGTNWSTRGTATGTTYTDTGLSRLTGFHYRVVATNSSGSSSPSSSIYAKTRRR